MPTFKFTGPDGTEYYGDGNTASDAFSAANIDTLAAERSRASPYGRMSENLERGERERAWEGVTNPPEKQYAAIAEEGARALPGVSPVIDAARGDYGTAAGEAALSVLPYGARYVPAAAKALGVGGAALFSGSAMGEESQFPFIEDPKERAAADAAYKGIKGYIKDKRTGESQYDRGETARLRSEFMAARQAEARTRSEKAAAERKKVEGLADFEKRNKDAIAQLTPDQKAQYDAREVPGNIEATMTNKADYLAHVAAERENLTKGFAERNPEAMEWLQKGSYAASATIPIATLANRASTLRRAAKEAEDAYMAAIKGGGRKTTRDANEAALRLRGNQLESTSALQPIDYSMIAASPFIPVAAAEAPNFIDLATLQNHPDSPAYKHAWEMIDPTSEMARQTAGRALGEGLTATAAGFGIGEPVSRFPVAKARAAGTLKTIREREAAADAERLAAETRKATAAGARGTARSKVDEAEARARQAVADANKRVYAASTPTPAQQQRAAAEAAAAEQAARAAAERKAIRALKAGKATKAGDVLSSGTGSALE